MDAKEYRTLKNITESLPETKKSTLTAREQIGGLRIVATPAKKVSKEAAEWERKHTARRREQAIEKRNAKKNAPLTHSPFKKLKDVA